LLNCVVQVRLRKDLWLCGQDGLQGLLNCVMQGRLCHQNLRVRVRGKVRGANPRGIKGVL
jgi:hypothetical protein